MGPFLGVMPDILPEDLLEVALAQDENVLQTLAPHGSHEPFGKGIRLGRAYRSPDDADAFGAKHLVKRPRVLGGAVADQELGVESTIKKRT
jgi:hypothetical protein